MQRFTVFALIGAFAFLGACAESSEPDADPTPEESYNMIEPVTADVPASPEAEAGEWVSSTLEGEPALLFGPPESEAQFSMRCRDGGGLVLQRAGIVPEGAVQMMMVSVDGANAQFAVNETGDEMPLLTAIIPDNEPFLDMLRDAAGPLTIRVGGGSPLVLPPNPEIGELVETCLATQD